MKHRQDGIALIGLLALLTLGAGWWLVSALANPANRVASDREHNARILAQAKVALIGTVGLMAGDAATPEANPGRLPCPEAPASANNFGGGVYVVADDGIAAGNCNLPAVGRLPWRTLGIDKLVDAAGEPLWYVVSPAWALSNATLPPLQTTINSQGPAGQLTLDGAGDIVALIIAPGPPLNIQAGGGCVARVQARLRAPNVNWDARDFLDCTNSDGDAAFATGGPAGSFNDQVLAVTSGELLPVIESAVADRFVRQMGANMRYCGAPWPACSGAGAAAYYPFAATFGDPAAASYQGVLNLTQGLPPLSFSAAGPCTVAGSYCNPPAACNPALDNRCAPTLVTYRSNPVITQTAAGDASVSLNNYSCSVAGTPNTLTCTMNVRHSVFTPVANRWMEFDLDVTSNNIGMALRDLNGAVQMTGVQTAGAGTVNSPFGYSLTSAAMNADASAAVRIHSRVPGSGGGLVADLACGLLGWLLQLLYDCNAHTIPLPFIWVDEPMLYANNATMEWWYRNGWQQLTYYAVASGNAPSGSGTCVAGTTCLSVAGPTVANTQRSVLVMPGRALAGQNRTPPLALNSWLEGGNADLDTAFAARDPVLAPVRAFNDHVVTLGSN
ncbi:MAG: hypothetical protein ACT4P3_07440 [Betaproteobacteria bacterium]